MSTILKHSASHSVGHIHTAALLAFFALLLPAAAPADEPDITVAYLAGGHEDNEFWASMTGFAQAVADDLDIDLQVTYPETIAEEGPEILGKLDEGDYFLTLYLNDVTHEFLQIAERRKVRSFLINTDIIEADREQLGMPREKFRYWIGHMQPDDVQAGYRVADELLGHFERPETARVIAINGDDHVQADADRQAGLRQRLSETPGATLLAVERADWQQSNARKAAGELLEAHPQANAAWAASDPMAMGAAAAFKEAGRQPGKDFVAAGIDWSGEGLAAVRSGEMLATVGGHFLEAGIALMLIYDYHHGQDFAGDPGVHFKTPMNVIGRGNIDTYYEKAGTAPDWSAIDFKQFTKTHNPNLDKYDFSWPAIVDQL